MNRYEMEYEMSLSDEEEKEEIYEYYYDEKTERRQLYGSLDEPAYTLSEWREFFGDD